MAYGRKRKYLGSSRRPAKRGRFSGRKRRFARKRGPSNITWTSQTGVGKNLGYKSRKLSKSAWRRKLWNDTLAVQHYRSIGVGPGVATSGSVQGTGENTLVFPTFVGTPGPTTAFWTTTGGLQITDEGGASVTFDETDLVIRGGRVGITVTCPDTITEELGVTVSVVNTIANPDIGLLNGTTTYGSNIDAGPDFTRRFGRVLYRKTTILSNTFSNFTYEHRLKVQKIDQETHGTVFGSQIVFIVTVTPLQTSPVTEYSLPYLAYHDMSFTGDTD